MSNETKGLDGLDPLARFSILSLFPQTLGVLQTAPQHSDLEQDLDSLHDHVKSLVSQSPKKLLDKAKAVMEENKKLSINVPSNAAQDNSELIVAAYNNPKKRRLGLDRKRPHFSMKPDLSQPSVNLEPSFNVDDYEDPDELFAAFEKFEAVKKEIQRQRGISQKDNVLCTNSLEVRPRRPALGVFRRSYKHLFSESDILPREVLPKNTNAPSNADLQESIELNIPSKERDVTGSEKEVDEGNGILDELLSKNLEDLEGDGAINLVKKHLHMEDLIIEPLRLPEMQNVRMVSMKASIRNIRPRRALSDIQNLSKGVLRSSDAKCSGTVSSKGSLSKNRPKSPHAQIAMLKKRLFDAKSSVDPFSSIFVDEVDAHSVDVNMSNNSCISGKLRSPITLADDNAPAEVGTSGETLELSVLARDDTVGLNFNEEHSHDTGSMHINDDLTNTISGFDIDQTVSDEDMNIADFSLDVLGQEEAMIPSESDPNMENLNSKENTITTDLEEPPVCSIDEEQSKDGSSKGTDSASEQQPKDGISKGADSAPEEQVEEPTQSQPNGKSQGKLGTRKSNKRKVPSSDENPEDISNPATVDCENAESADASPEEPHEEAPRELANEESKLEQRKKKQQRKKLDSSRRQSLGGAGTKWEKCMLKKGNNDESEKVVRRSTRIRSRPLAYWKGERFLYGRVHQSMATVIGVKSFGTPGNDGNPSLKVKSFVDDKFKDLVEFAGLH